MLKTLIDYCFNGMFCVKMSLFIADEIETFMEQKGWATFAIQSMDVFLAFSTLQDKFSSVDVKAFCIYTRLIYLKLMSLAVIILSMLGTTYICE